MKLSVSRSPIGQVFILDKDGKMILKSKSNTFKDYDVAKNIINSVNLHDELVEMVKELSPYVDSGNYEGNESQYALSLDIKDLLNKAKGGTL